MKEKDTSALSMASYGLYLLSAKNNEQDNACIINTFLQVTSSMPVGCLISVSKQNYTAEIISTTKKFNLSPLTVQAPFELFKRFGYQSGRKVNKFDGFNDYSRSANGLTCLTEFANALLSFEVMNRIDFDTHFLFLATLVESKILNQNESMTYHYYHQNVQPKPETVRIAGYRCKICRFVYEGETLPPDYICPLCKHGVADFEKIG